ncbi:hypothetical protein OIA45_49125 (plasmid) [Streptomyces chartreusis]|uniref:hypothetical protein n=1 Tax=Streptomyces chartreusis TaxID=1969 RepID=UPI0037DDD006|nr:hypothetical protein OIA45_49125 [Streptomyces chartreusis]
MTDPTATEHRVTSPSFPEGHPMYAPPLTAEDRADVLERLERSQRDAIEHRSRVDRAHVSPEARAVKDVVLGDGNVAWPEFVKHCGGILEAVALVDEQGRPDTDRIIAKVDETFAHLFPPEEFLGGMTVTRKPQNRPYVPKRPPAPTFPGDGEVSARDAEKLLEEERRPSPQTTARR